MPLSRRSTFDVRLVVFRISKQTHCSHCHGKQSYDHLITAQLMTTDTIRLSFWHPVQLQLQQASLRCPLNIYISKSKLQNCAHRSDVRKSGLSLGSVLLLHSILHQDGKASDCFEHRCRIYGCHEKEQRTSSWRGSDLQEFVFGESVEDTLCLESAASLDKPSVSSPANGRLGHGSFRLINSQADSSMNLKTQFKYIMIPQVHRSYEPCFLDCTLQLALQLVLYIERKSQPCSSDSCPLSYT